MAKPVAIIGTHIERTLLMFGRQTQQYLMLLFAVVIGLCAVIRAVITQSQDTMLLVDAESRAGRLLQRHQRQAVG